MCRHVGTTMLVRCQKTTVGASPSPPLCDRVSLFFLLHPLCVNQTSCPRTSGYSPVFISHPPVGVTLFQMFIRRVILTQRLNVRTLLDCSSIKTLKQCTKLSYSSSLSWTVYISRGCYACQLNYGLLFFGTQSPSPFGRILRKELSVQLVWS